MEDERERAAALIEAEQDAICLEIVKVQRRLVPRLLDLTEGVAADLARGLVLGVTHILRGSPASMLTGAAREAARLRVAQGFGPGEITLLTHGYLTALRRVFIARLGVEEGLHLFEVAEDAMFDGLRAIGSVIDEVARNDVKP